MLDVVTHSEKEILMIVRNHPSPLHLFFIIRGSVVPVILGEIICVALLSVATLVLDRFVVPLPHISIAAMSVFGVALSLFLGFRNNAAYDRWWESRKLWGTMLAEIRNLGRCMTMFVGNGDERKNILSYAVVFAHLHRGFLRNVDVSAEIVKWIGAQKTADLIAQKNPADAALRLIAEEIETLSKQGRIDGFGKMTLSQSLSTLGLAQAGCERIVTTPLPFVYSLLVRRTSYLYCCLLPFALIESTGWFAPIFSVVVAYVFFGLLTVTNDLELPFRDIQNGLPLDALCRVIEISVSEALNIPAPEPIAVTDHVLT
jgi:putative membrane protein